MRKLQKDKISFNARIIMITKLIKKRQVTTIDELAELTCSSANFVQRLLRYHIADVKKIKVYGQHRRYFFYFEELTENKLERIEALKK